MFLFPFCFCFPCFHFRLDLITHRCAPLTFWSIMPITDLHSIYVTHLFVICRLLATSLLCLSSASQLLYMSDVKYKYSTCWGDCPWVRISSWILPANSPLSPLSPLPSGNSNLHRTSVSLSLSPPKYEDAGIARVQHIRWSQVLNTSTSPPLVIDNPLYLSPLVLEFIRRTGSDTETWFWHIERFSPSFAGQTRQCTRLVPGTTLKTAKTSVVSNYTTCQTHHWGTSYSMTVWCTDDVTFYCMMGVTYEYK